MQNIVEADKLELVGRKKLIMSGVSAVDGFGEQFLDLTVSGTRVKISGTKIKITAFNKATGSLTADGEFTEIKYMGAKVPFMKKLFK